MSKDDPKRDGEIDLIARNTCDIKKRTVFCCDSEQTPKELTKQNFIEDLLSASKEKRKIPSTFIISNSNFSKLPFQRRPERFL